MRINATCELENLGFTKVTETTKSAFFRLPLETGYHIKFMGISEDVGHWMVVTCDRQVFFCTEDPLAQTVLKKNLEMILSLVNNEEIVPEWNDFGDWD